MEKEMHLCMYWFPELTIDSNGNKVNIDMCDWLKHSIDYQYCTLCEHFIEKI